MEVVYLWQATVLILIQCSKCCVMVGLSLSLFELHMTVKDLVSGMPVSDG